MSRVPPPRFVTVTTQVPSSRLKVPPAYDASSFRRLAPSSTQASATSKAISPSENSLARTTSLRPTRAIVSPIAKSTAETTSRLMSATTPWGFLISLLPDDGGPGGRRRIDEFDVFGRGRVPEAELDGHGA